MYTVYEYLTATERREIASKRTLDDAMRFAIAWIVTNGDWTPYGDGTYLVIEKEGREILCINSEYPDGKYMPHLDYLSA